MEACLLCGQLSYKTDADYICGSCVQLLLNADQQDLRRAHTTAIEKGYSNKARAIESFLISQEESNDRKTKKLKSNMVRERTVRTVRPTRDQLRTQPTIVPLD